MKTFSVNVAFVVSVLLGSASAAVSSALQEQTSGNVATLAVADFSSFGKSVTNDFSIPEIELSGGVEVGAAGPGPVLYGAYWLGPVEVDQITRIVPSELEQIPASEAVLLTTVPFPGLIVYGQSVANSTTNPLPLRIPTIFAPQYSGYKFELAGRASPPGTTLHFSNMTIVMPDASYLSMAEAGFMDYFELGETARVCVTNSMFVLGSCDGFSPEPFHVWCCTRNTCNIQYTQQAMIDLGYPLEEDLEPLTCHSGNTTAAEASGDGSAASEADDVEGQDVATEDIPAADQEAVGGDSEPREALTSVEETDGGSGGVASGAVVVAALFMAAM